MIDKQQAKDNGIKTIEGGEAMMADKMALIKRLKAVLPSVINADNQLDTKALADVVDIANTTSNNQGYELTFAGKGIARAMADRPTELELKAELAQSKDFDNTQNTVIRGDNLEVLKILQANYHNKIKMIYIDPPYNTKKENFIYKDNFKQSDADLIEKFALNEESVDFLHNVYGTRSHSGWLSFIYPRLKLARDLLSDDGVIFISIDDNEQANLKVLCDEIFGEDNFVSEFIWEKKKKPAFLHKNVGKLAEYILCYTKNTKQSIPFSVEETEEGKNTPINNAGNSKSILIFPKGSVSFSMNNQIVEPQNMSDGNILTKLLKPVKITNGINQDELVLEGEWRYSQQTIDEIVANGDEIRISKIPFRPNRIKKGGEIKKMKNIFSSNHYQMSTNEDATEYLMNLLNTQNIFDNSKPHQLVEILIKSITYQEKSGVILDFFAGSGTTGDAVMQLNAQDGGKRKFILVQIDEKIDKKKSTEAHKFCTDNNFAPVISSITIERLNRAGNKIITDLKSKNNDLFNKNSLSDIGYKVFSLSEKPRVIQENDKHANFTGFKVVNKRVKTLDTLANMLIATCKTLDTEIECLFKDMLYRADNELYLLDNIAVEELEKYTDFKINLDGWADINLEQYLNLGVEQKDNISVIY